MGHVRARQGLRLKGLKRNNATLIKDILEITLKKLFILVPVLAIAACTTELTEDAMKVRRIPAAINSGCQFLGPVSGSESFGMTIAEDAESSMNQV